MRFMMLMIPSVYQGGSGNDLPADFAPPADMVEKMMKYNEELAKAGALISLDGLHPSGKGALVSFAGGQPKVIDGPFSESKEMVGGFFLLDCDTKEEALAIASECPAAEWATVEVREFGPCFM